MPLFYHAVFDEFADEGRRTGARVDSRLERRGDRERTWWRERVWPPRCVALVEEHVGRVGLVVLVVVVVVVMVDETGRVGAAGVVAAEALARQVVDRVEAPHLRIVEHVPAVVRFDLFKIIKTQQWLNYFKLQN